MEHLDSPHPSFLIPQVIRQLVSKDVSYGRLHNYLTWVFDLIKGDPDVLENMHSIVSSTFIYDLHRAVLASPHMRSILVKIVQHCGTGGSRVWDASGGNLRAIEAELLDWLTLGKPESVQFYIVEEVTFAKMYICRPLFDFQQDWSFAECWTVQQMEDHPTGAIFLPAKYFYGSYACPESLDKDKDRTEFDTLLTLAYLREICRAVAVWAYANDPAGNLTDRQWFTWGVGGKVLTDGITNPAIVETLQRYIFLGNEIMGLRHQEKKASATTTSNTSTTNCAAPPPFYAHYGPCNLANPPLQPNGKLAEVALHHPITSVALHAYLEEVFDSVSFPGMRFKIDNDHRSGLRWSWGADWSMLFRAKERRLRGCYGTWIKDGRFERKEGKEKIRRPEEVWEAVDLEWRC